MPKSATASSRTPAVLVTCTPARVAASTSMSSTPTEMLEMTLRVPAFAAMTSPGMRICKVMTAVLPATRRASSSCGMTPCRKKSKRSTS